MEPFYIYHSGIVLNDALFEQYGGQTGTSLPVQRDAAYLLAEQQMTTYLGTYLYPTILTGTIAFQGCRGIVSTEKGCVQRILNMRVLGSQYNELFTISGTNRYAWISDDTFGYIKYVDNIQQFACGVTGTPTYLEYVYEAGLPSGTVTQPAMLLGLTMAAQINLNEMVFPFSNETTGDAGVEEYRSLQYSEKRKPWKNTAFGASPKAAKIAQLVDSTVKKFRKALVLN